MLFDNTLYMNADAAAYKSDFDVASTPLAGKWAQVPSSNAMYSDIAGGILLPSVVQETTDISSAKIVGLKTFDGKSAFAIEGHTIHGGDSLETVYVSTVAPFLPVGIKVIAVSGSTIATDAITFSDWGAKFSLSKPATFVVATNKTFP